MTGCIRHQVAQYLPACVDTVEGRSVSCAPAMDRIREIASRVSNWGRWGAEDERGTVNFITPEVIRRAAAGVKRGQVFSLALPFDGDGRSSGRVAG